MTISKKEKIVAAVIVNAQSQLQYQRSLQKALAKMHASYTYWIRSKYRKAVITNQEAGRLAEDAAPGADMDAMLKELLRLQTYWTKYFNDFSLRLTTQTLGKWYRDNSNQWDGKLYNTGFDVPMQLTAAQRVILEIKTPENVALIKSIQEQYHTNIVGIVTRNFVRGRDLAAMAIELQHCGKVSQTRAAFIARDQANKATAAMNDARQRQLGITYGVWQHSSAGKEPRPTHVRAGREKWLYRVGHGIDFGDQFGMVLPGDAINCRCTSRSVLPNLTETLTEDDLEPIIEFPGAYRRKKT